jgi:hypothetical protein
MLNNDHLKNPVDTQHPNGIVKQETSTSMTVQNRPATRRLYLKNRLTQKVIIVPFVEQQSSTIGQSNQASKQYNPIASVQTAV